MIRVLRGDLATAPVQGLVRPIRSDGEAVTAVGRRLEVTAGEAVAARVHELGDLPVGGAVITPGGNLSAEFVIHVVVQSVDEPVSALGVQRALLNGLRRAKEWGLASVAFPPVGGGAGNLDPEQAASILVGVLGDHLLDRREPQSLTIVVDNDYEEQVYDRLVSALEGA